MASTDDRFLTANSRLSTLVLAESAEFGAGADVDAVLGTLLHNIASHDSVGLHGSLLHGSNGNGGIGGNTVDTKGECESTGESEDGSLHFEKCCDLAKIALKCLVSGVWC